MVAIIIDDFRDNPDSGVQRNYSNYSKSSVLSLPQNWQSERAVQVELSIDLHMSTLEEQPAG